MQLRQFIERLAVRTLFSFDADDVVSRLRMFGVEEGDTLMVHASWRSGNGFKGRPLEMIGALQRSVGAGGLLVMPSLTYHNKTSREFLASGVPMDVRRSPSRMGLLT